MKEPTTTRSNAKQTRYSQGTLTGSRLLVEALGIADAIESALSSPFPASLPDRPRHLYTLARGSSLHAATVVHRFFGCARIPASTLAPGLVQPSLQLNGAVVLVISQSGASPDLCSAASNCVRNGSPVIALVNTVDSELESVATLTIHQQAGTELAIAATKSVMCSIVAGARLAEHWGAPSFELETLATHIRAIQSRDQQALVTFLARNEPLLVVGRGTGNGIASEVALKAQELLGRAATAYSSAEVLHGPAGMVGAGFPVLALAVGAESETVRACADKLAEYGADVLLVDDALRVDELASTVVLAGLYPVFEAAARVIGRSPDSPPNLSKVTLTD